MNRTYDDFYRDFTRLFCEVNRASRQARTEGDIATADHLERAASLANRAAVQFIQIDEEKAAAEQAA